MFNHDDSMKSIQVRFASHVDTDAKSEKTDKRNNLANDERKSRKNRTGIRSKFILEGIRQELYHLQRENEVLRRIVQERVQPIELAESILLECESPPVDIFLRSSILMEDETKEGDESNSGRRNVVRTVGSPKVMTSHLTRVGEEIQMLRPPVPIKELLIPQPMQKEKPENIRRFMMEKIDFSEKDQSQILVDAFKGEFAY
mmetsp:Transcript_10444/g.13212  ORF Transcript_10444/g.13212 Transcript_10444/m.13212 type:complete len:201 (+) Transcript_10444:79-681(+)